VALHRLRSSRVGLQLLKLSSNRSLEPPEIADVGQSGNGASGVQGSDETHVATPRALQMDIFQCCTTPDRGLCPPKDKKRFDESIGRHPRPFIPPGEGPLSEEIPKLVLVLQSWAKSDFVSDPNTVMHCKPGPGPPRCVPVLAASSRARLISVFAGIDLYEGELVVALREGSHG
jgi:hypothetical protein